MTRLVIAAVVAGVFFSQQAQDRATEPQVPEDRSGQQKATPRHPRHDPWGSLFTLESIGPGVQRQQELVKLHMRAVQPGTTSTVPTAERGPCNMPIVPANPAVDPKMVIPHRPEGVDPKIRVIEPTVCGQQSARKRESDKR